MNFWQFADLHPFATGIVIICMFGMGTDFIKDIIKLFRK